MIGGEVVSDVGHNLVFIVEALDECQENDERNDSRKALEDGATKENVDRFEKLPLDHQAVRAHYGALRLADFQDPIYRCVIRWRRMESSADAATGADSTQNPLSGIWEYENPAAVGPIEDPKSHGALTIVECPGGLRLHDAWINTTLEPVMCGEEEWWRAFPTENHPGIYLRLAQRENTLEFRLAVDDVVEAVRRPSTVGPSMRSTGWGFTLEKALWSAMHSVVVRNSDPQD